MSLACSATGRAGYKKPKTDQKVHTLLLKRSHLVSSSALSRHLASRYEKDEKELTITVDREEARDRACRGDGPGAPENRTRHCSGCFRHSLWRDRIRLGARSWAWLEGICHQIARTRHEKSSQRHGRRPAASFIGHESKLNKRRELRLP